VAGGAARSAQAVSPTQKVLQLLQNMIAKANTAKQDEEVAFAKYSQWCKNTQKTTDDDIKAEKRDEEELEAEIQQLTEDIRELKKQAEELDENVATWTQDKKAAAEVRGMERKDFTATLRDYTESETAIKGAIAELEKQGQGDDADSLLQVGSLSTVGEEAKARITAYLDAKARTGAGTKGLDGIKDMLNDLKAKFKTQLRDLEKKELEAKHDFEQLQQQLTNEIDGATQSRNRKKGAAESKGKRKGEAEGELASTKADLESDTKYLDDLKAECNVKANDFENRSKLRGDEIDALQKAVDILSSDDVSGAADKHLPSFVQRSSSFAQLRSAMFSPTQAKAQEYLLEQSSQINSQMLAQLSTLVSEDPFQKVKKLIKDMVVRLKEEANEEAEKSGWCNTELTTNERQRVRKTHQVEVLHSDIDELQAHISKLSQQIADEHAAIASIDEALTSATETRTAEAKKNAAAIQDAQGAQQAVKAALVILKDFYGKAKDAESFVDTRAKQEPETFDEPYKGMQSESTGVIGMLEVIQSDFTRLEADTKASEAAASDEFKEFESDSQVDKASKNVQIDNMEQERETKREELTQAKKSLDSTQKELSAALEYYDKLKPSCVSAGVDYQERTEMRAKEIQSLKETLKILNGEI